MRNLIKQQFLSIIVCLRDAINKNGEALYTWAAPKVITTFMNMRCGSQGIVRQFSFYWSHCQTAYFVSLNMSYSKHAEKRHQRKHKSQRKSECLQALISYSNKAGLAWKGRPRMRDNEKSIHIWRRIWTWAKYEHHGLKCQVIWRSEFPENHWKLFISPSFIHWQTFVHLLGYTRAIKASFSECSPAIPPTTVLPWNGLSSWNLDHRLGIQPTLYSTDIFLQKLGIFWNPVSSEHYLFLKWSQPLPYQDPS